MNLLQQLTPVNLDQEKQKFFSDQSYNPQFIYTESVDEDKLRQYPKPSQELVKLAEKIVAKKLEDPSPSENLGRILTQAEVTEKAKLFLQLHGLENRFSVVWSASFLSRATMTTNALKLKTVATFRELGTAGMLFHEVGTHALRRVNYEQQPWYRKKKKYGFSEYLETEEGLASLHSLLPIPNKSLAKSAIRFLATSHSQTKSFSQLWEFLSPLISDTEERWMVVARQKRGIADTALPGTFMKDALYFSGAVKMARWLTANKFDLTLLYYGKLAVEDIEKAMQLNPNFEPKLPSFFVTDKDMYTRNISAIVAYNNL